MIKFRISRWFKDENAPIEAIEIVRETEKTYTIMQKDWRTDKMSESSRNMKDTTPIYDTFDLARAEWVRQRQEAVENIKKQIVDRQAALIKAEARLAAASYIQPPA